MKFISVRDFRSGSTELFSTGPDQEDFILTNHGKPTAIVVPLGEDNFEETVAAIRQAKALRSLSQLQTHSRQRGLDQMTLSEIDALIQRARKVRNTKSL